MYPTHPAIASIGKQKQNRSNRKNLFFSPEVLSLVTLHLIFIRAVMAFRSMGNLRSIMGRLRGNATYATSTTPKTKAYAPAADYGHTEDHRQHTKPKLAVKGHFVPVYVAIGMITLSVGMGLHTAKQQLAHSPTVRVSKKTRETLPEVENPDKVVDEADKFFKKSFFRKVAHVQEFDYGDHSISDPIRKDAYAYQPRVETLKTVGVDPKLH